MNNKLRVTCAFVLFLLLANTATAQDQPTLAKDSLQITAFTVNSYKGNYDVWSWLPRMQFRVNGPIASGSQLYVQYSLPTGPWVKFDCDTNNTEKGYWWKTECGGRQIEAQSSTYTGPVNFVIKMRNELQGTDSTLFSGKMKVAKAKSNEVGPKAAQKFVYWVDHDWNLPMGRRAGLRRRADRRRVPRRHRRVARLSAALGENGIAGGQAWSICHRPGHPALRRKFDL